MLSERYLATTSPQRIAAHLRLLDRLAEEGVLATELFHHPDLGLLGAGGRHPRRAAASSR